MDDHGITKAAVLYEPGLPLVIEELKLPLLKEGQVLVKMAASGLCHTQLNEILGKRGPDPFLPHLLGHEGSGVVKAVGKGVAKVKAGDSVIISWIKGEGIAAKPPTYKLGRKKINAGPCNTLAEQTIVSENRVTPILKKIPFDQAALIGCAVATGFGSIFNMARPAPKSSVAVFGAGGVGLNVIQAAHLAKANPIIAVDIQASKLKMAKSFGATHAFHAKRQNVLESILKTTQGRGVDYAIEAAGSKEAMEIAYQAIRKEGGVFIVIGNLSYRSTISIDPFELIGGKRLLGSAGGDTYPDRDFPKYIELLRKGHLQLNGLITHRFSLDQINTAFALLKKGMAGRILIEFQ